MTKIKCFKAMFFLLFIIGSFVADEANAYTVEELCNLTEQIQNNTPGIKIELTVDRSEYRIGEDVCFSFKADKDCYMALINIGTSGRVTILFPNALHPDNRIEKGKVYKIPSLGSEFRFRVMGPAGIERVKAIASIEPAMSKIESLQAELRKPTAMPTVNVQAITQVFVTISQWDAVLKDIGVTMSKLDPEKWGTASLVFNVTGVAPTNTPQTVVSATASASASTGLTQHFAQPIRAQDVILKRR